MVWRMDGWNAIAISAAASATATTALIWYLKAHTKSSSLDTSSQRDVSECERNAHSDFDSSPRPQRKSSIPLPRKLFRDCNEGCSEVFANFFYFEPNSFLASSEFIVLQVALIDEQLRILVDLGVFELPTGINLSEYVQPASIDLPVTGEIFLVKEKVLPFQQKISDLIDNLALEKKSLMGKGAVLLKGQVVQQLIYHF